MGTEVNLKRYGAGRFLFIANRVIDPIRDERRLKGLYDGAKS